MKTRLSSEKQVLTCSQSVNTSLGRKFWIWKCFIQEVKTLGCISSREGCQKATIPRQRRSFPFAPFPFCSWISLKALWRWGEISLIFQTHLVHFRLGWALHGERKEDGGCYSKEKGTSRLDLETITGGKMQTEMQLQEEKRQILECTWCGLLPARGAGATGSNREG